MGKERKITTPQLEDGAELLQPAGENGAVVRLVAALGDGGAAARVGVGDGARMAVVVGRARHGTRHRVPHQRRVADVLGRVAAAVLLFLLVEKAPPEPKPTVVLALAQALLHRALAGAGSRTHPPRHIRRAPLDDELHCRRGRCGRGDERGYEQEQRLPCHG